MPTTTRLLEIDFLRFLAALSVLGFHYLYAGNITGDMELPIPDRLEAVAQFGYLGVDLFFVISGFVIAMSMQHGNPLRFLVDRLIRLYPVFFFAVLLTASVRVTLGNQDDSVAINDLLLNLALFPGIFEQSLDIEFVDGVYWSLMLELQFYFLVLVVLLVRLKNYFELLVFAWLATTVASDWVELPIWLNKLLILEWSPYFIAGILFQQIHQHGHNLIRWTGLAICFYLAINYGLWRLDFLHNYYEEAFDPTVTGLLITAIFLLFTLLVTGGLAFLRLPGMLWLGGLTYPLYLLHQNIGYILFRTFDLHATPTQLLLGMTLFMLLLSLLIHLLIERQFARWLRGKAHAMLASREPAQASSQVARSFPANK